MRFYKIWKTFRFVLVFLLFVLIIFLIPNNNTESELIIRKKMPKRDQLALLREISYTPYLLFAISKLKKIRYGVYVIPAKQNNLAILHLLWHGKQKLEKITIPEGYSAFQILKLLKNTQNLIGETPVELKEGQILANSYMYVTGTTRKELLNFMISESDKQKDEIWNKGTIWKDKNEWITFASLLEKEGYDYEDKNKISGVLMNRLQKKMRLQVDATLLYIKSHGKFNTQISFNELVNKKFSNDVKYENPYNTYLYVGLPPGPICSPGIDSLKISINPQKNKYMYYRVVNGKHKFSETFIQHKRMKYQRNVS